jgi:glutathione peroxidase
MLTLSSVARIALYLLLINSLTAKVFAQEEASKMSTEDTTSGLLNHTLTSLSPKGSINLQKEYAGKVILAVNTASACGYTPQYAELEKLYQKYKDQGLAVLGFPSDDFNQEPKAGDELVTFCKLKYDVTFPIFKKSAVTGANANAFYQQLIANTQGQAPRWNFYKYLIDSDQKVVGFYPSQEKPLGGELEQKIQSLLYTQ